MAREMGFIYMWLRREFIFRQLLNYFCIDPYNTFSLVSLYPKPTEARISFPINSLQTLPRSPPSTSFVQNQLGPYVNAIVDSIKKSSANKKRELILVGHSAGAIIAHLVVFTLLHAHQDVLSHFSNLTLIKTGALALPEIFFRMWDSPAHQGDDRSSIPTPNGRALQVSSPRTRINFFLNDARCFDFVAFGKVPSLPVGTTPTSASTSAENYSARFPHLAERAFFDPFCHEPVFRKAEDVSGFLDSVLPRARLPVIRQNMDSAIKVVEAASLVEGGSSSRRVIILATTSGDGGTTTGGPEEQVDVVLGPVSGFHAGVAQTEAKTRTIYRDFVMGSLGMRKEKQMVIDYLRDLHELGRRYRHWFRRV